MQIYTLSNKNVEFSVFSKWIHSQNATWLSAYWGSVFGVKALKSYDKVFSTWVSEKKKKKRSLISRKGKGTRDQIANICWIIEKTGNSKKTYTSASLPVLKPLLWGSHQTEKFLKSWVYQSTLPVSWETCMQVKKQQLELDMEQQTDSKLRKEFIKAVYCYPDYLTYMQRSIMWNVRLVESQVGIKIARRNINNLRYADNTTPIAESEEELKSLLMWVKEECEKPGLKLNIQKTNIMASVPSLHGK